MKNKGFTLIELLAVIVILAIIALIAVPIILNIIDGSKKSSNERSVELYLNAVEQAIARKNLTGEFNPSTCTVKSDGNLTCDEVELIVEVKGTKPDSGTIKLEKVSVKKYELYIKGEKYTNIEYTPDSCFGVTDNGDGTATITGYSCSYKDVVIPKEIELKTIKSATFNVDKCKTYYIEKEGKTTEEATTNCNSSNESFKDLSVEEIKTQIDSTPQLVQMFDIEYLPEIKKIKVTSIGNGAFANKGLTSVEIPDSVISIGPGAFYGNQLISTEIPDSVTSIGEGAFSGNQLTDLKLGNSVTSIGRGAFSENQLTSVEIPDSVTSIGEGAFSGNQLKSVEIGNGVTSIGTGAFQDNQLTSVKIGNSVKSIGEGAFFGNQLTNVEIPDSVTSIGTGAFSGNQLTDLKLGNSVTSIGDSAFSRNQLTSVELPDSVTSIGNGAFSVNQLTSVIIKAPQSQVTLGVSAFGDFDTANIVWQS